MPNVGYGYYVNVKKPQWRNGRSSSPCSLSYTNIKEKDKLWISVWKETPIMAKFKNPRAKKENQLDSSLSSATHIQWHLPQLFMHPTLSTRSTISNPYKAVWPGLHLSTFLLLLLSIVTILREIATIFTLNFLQLALTVLVIPLPSISCVLFSAD